MRDLARLAVSASLQVVSQLLAGTWGFGLVLREVTAAPTLPGAGYLDVRVVVYAQGELRDIHVIALPQLERRTAFELAQTIETVLDAVFPLWRTRVLGISHDGHPGTGGRNDPPHHQQRWMIELLLSYRRCRRPDTAQRRCCLY